MEIFTRGIVDDFISKHSDAMTSLNRWFLTTSVNDWESPKELLETFSYVDHVGNNLYVST